MAKSRGRRIHNVQGVHGDHAAEKSAPRQFGRPKGGGFLEGEEHPRNRGPKSRGDTRRRPASDEVALFLVVAEVLDFGPGSVEA